MAAPQSKGTGPNPSPTAVNATQTQTTGTGQKVPGVSFGGKPCYIVGPNYFTLGLGTAPSSGTITMSLRDVLDLQAVDDGFTLKMKDSRQELKIEKLYIREVRHQDPVATGAAFVNVIIEDQRSRWQFSEVYGIFNKLREDGVNYVRPSINGNKPWTFDELLQKLIDALPDVDLTPKTGITFIPNDVVWEGANAAAMLQSMLQAVAWDIALKPDGSFELIDLSQQKGFKAPSGFTKWGDTEEEQDRAHRTPGTLKVIFRTFREIETGSWEPVLQVDEEIPARTAQGTAVKKGEWASAASVLALWGINEAFARAIFYRRGDEDFLWNRLGGGVKGRNRLAIIRAQLYRFWRFTDTDRDKILPIQMMRAETSTQDGRQTALGPRVTKADYHLQRRQGYGPYFRNVTGEGSIPWPVKIVDAREGIVEIKAKRPITNVSPIGSKSPFYAAGWQLDRPSAPRIVFGYYKKFSPKPEDDYFVVEKQVAAPNNGLTLTRKNSAIVVREVEGVKVNEAEVKAAAEKYLADWEKRFTIPQPRQVRLAGVWGQAKLDSTVRVITFRFENGTETNLRLNSDRSPDRYGLGYSTRLRSRKFAGQAEAASEVLLDTVAGGGGGGGQGKHQTGLLGQTPPQLVDFLGARESDGGYVEDESVLVNADHIGLLIAEDWTVPASKQTCKVTQITGRGSQRPTTTPGVASNPTGGGTQVSGIFNWQPAGPTTAFSGPG